MAVFGRAVEDGTTITGTFNEAIVLDEPGEDICHPSYPDNFVPATAVHNGFAWSCGGTGATVGIGYLSYPAVTFKTEAVDVEVGDSLLIQFTGWAGGSTGPIAIEASVSADDASFVSCGVSPARNFLGNSTADTVSCGSPISASELYVRLQTTSASPALVYLRHYEGNFSGRRHRC